MSGLCGWFSGEPAALPIGQMAGALCRFDQSGLRTGAHGLGAVALAGPADRAALYHEDGLLIAHWGEGAEALARLWRTNGAKACAALPGHFAFAILDERRGEALLAVDRGATRPLFYQVVGHTLLFASSLDALVQHPGAGRALDPQALLNYLYFQTVPAPGAMYKGPKRLAPGEFVHMHGGRVERTRYWRLRFQEHQPAGLPELKGELRDGLAAALEASRGQQRAGVMLSGGTGSAALAALLNAAGGGRVPTFAVGAGSGPRGALAAARAAARLLHAEHHERQLGPADAAAAIPKLAAVFDQPCGEPGALAAYHCALLAREAGVARILAGHGGNVLLGRGERYALQVRLSGYERLPSALRQLLLEPLLFRFGARLRGGALAAARTHIEQSVQPFPARLRRSNLLLEYGPAGVLEPDLLAVLDASAPQAALEQAWWLAQCRAPVNRMIALDLEHTLPEHALPATARACELAGVDADFPFLDDVLVAFAARLEPRHKGDDAARDLLREALRGTLPARLCGTGADGFELPFGQWLLADARLKNLAFDSLAELRRRRILRAGFSDALLARLPERPGRHGRMVWLLMMLEQWFALRKVELAPAAASAREPLASVY